MMHFRRPIASILLTCFFSALLLSNFAGTPANIPPTGQSLEIPSKTGHNAVGQNLDQFVQSVQNGDPDVLVGVYVPDLFAVPVVQQPGNDAGFVSQAPETVTQFAAANKFGTRGLLAHNYLTGKQFFKMELDQEIYLVYGDGSTRSYTVTQIDRYQALQPHSTLSNFVDLKNPNQGKISAGELFRRVYTHGDQVVFQTCIERDGEWSWGRIFITATPTQEVDRMPAGGIAPFNKSFEYHYYQGHFS